MLSTALSQLLDNLLERCFRHIAMGSIRKKQSLNLNWIRKTKLKIYSAQLKIIKGLRLNVLSSLKKTIEIYILQFSVWCRFRKRLRMLY